MLEINNYKLTMLMVPYQVLTNYASLVFLKLEMQVALECQDLPERVEYPVHQEQVEHQDLPVSAV